MGGHWRPPIVEQVEPATPSTEKQPGTSATWTVQYGPYQGAMDFAQVGDSHCRVFTLLSAAQCLS